MRTTTAIAIFTLALTGSQAVAQVRDLNESRSQFVYRSLYEQNDAARGYQQRQENDPMEAYGNKLFGEAFRRALRGDYSRSSSNDWMPPSSSTIANTGGPWRITGLAPGELSYVAKVPHPKTMRETLARLRYDTRGIRLAGGCNSQSCPIYLNTRANGGIGWVHRSHITQ